MAKMMMGDAWENMLAQQHKLHVNESKFNVLTLELLLLLEVVFFCAVGWLEESLSVLSYVDQVFSPYTLSTPSFLQICKKYQRLNYMYKLKLIVSCYLFSSITTFTRCIKTIKKQMTQLAVSDPAAYQCWYMYSDSIWQQCLSIVILELIF